MQWHRFKKLSLLLALLTVSGCRWDNPPAQELCALNGFGLGDCVEPDGTTKVLTPSQMLNYVARSPSYEKSWDAWCYDTSEANVQPFMVMLYQEARHERYSVAYQ